MESEHENILREGIEILQKKGFRVIRLDHRVIPDAIALKGKTIMAVEVSTNPSNIFLTKQKFNSGSQYDSEIIIARPITFAKCYHTRDEYYFVIVENEKGHSYREVQRLFQKKFGRIVSIGTIHNWVKGESMPFILR